MQCTAKDIKDNRSGVGGKTQPNSMVQTFQFCEEKKSRRKKIKIWRERKKWNMCLSVMCRWCDICREFGDFASCVMVFIIVGFVLRYFLGFLSCFYLFALQLIHLAKIRGLERLKMRFCVFGIRIIMFLWCSKRGFCENYARVRMRV